MPGSGRGFKQITEGGNEIVAYLNDDVVIMKKAGAPTTDGAGLAGKGSLLIDFTNGVLYINTGTKTTPTWTKVGTQS